MLVRATSILTPFIQGSRSLFDQNFFDVFFCFNEEHRDSREIVAGVLVQFVDVSSVWQHFPDGFDSVKTPNFYVVKGVKWGYQQMIRFFWRSMFLLPQMANVSAYMRLDGDSCISHISRSPFAQLTRGVIYVRNTRLMDMSFVCRNLRVFVSDYVKYFSIQPSDPYAWQDAFDGDSVAGYYNNLEIMDVSFWMRKDVQHFVQFVDASWGIYTYRWGDAPLRYLALALFATPGEVADRPHEWDYRHPCREN
jgi:hypothetical protein